MSGRQIVDLGQGSGPSAQMRLGADRPMVRVARIAKAWSSFFMVSLLQVEATRRGRQKEKNLNHVPCSEDDKDGVRSESEDFV
jgi:hypothetical protein